MTRIVHAISLRLASLPRFRGTARKPVRTGEVVRSAHKFVPLLASAAVLLLFSGCGNDGDQARKDAGKAYCQALQKSGGLLEPMSQCLDEYAAATREKTTP